MRSIAPACCRAREVTTLAQHKLDAKLVPQFAQPGAQHRYQAMRLYECKITEQHGKVASERGAIASAAGCDVPLLGLPMCGEPATVTPADSSSARWSGRRT